MVRLPSAILITSACAGVQLLALVLHDDAQELRLQALLFTAKFTIVTFVLTGGVVRVGELAVRYSLKSGL